MAYVEFAGVSLDSRILTTSFACDLQACHGACCTVPGGLGAPVREDEVGMMLKAAEAVRPLLSARHLEVLDAHGPLEGPAGDRTTVCVDGAACVFVIEEGEIALCAIERLYRDGRLSWQKPVSCHLYPIRIDPGSPERVRYEEVPICRGGRQRGERENIRLTDFLREALGRAYDRAWTEAVNEAAKEGPTRR
jgi:hypothetical protein